MLLGGFLSYWSVVGAAYFNDGPVAFIIFSQIFLPPATVPVVCIILMAGGLLTSSPRVAGVVCILYKIPCCNLFSAAKQPLLR